MYYVFTDGYNDVGVYADTQEEALNIAKDMLRGFSDSGVVEFKGEYEHHHEEDDIV